MSDTDQATNQRQQVIVSMTSFPAAISYAEKAIRSILEGSILPDKCVLYLTLAQFEDQSVLDSLRSLAKENTIFEIRNYDRDIRSYRKLIPALIDFPEAVIVTVDDDVWYHRDMLRNLLNLHAQIPDAILAHRAKLIKLGKPYRKWRKYRWYHFLFKRIHRSYLNLQTGCAGVLYPPHALKEDMMDVDLFTQIAPSTDDIWFWAAGVANDVPVVPVPFGQNKPQGLHKPKALSLKTVNFKAGTDRNLMALNAICDRFPEVRQRINAEL